MTQTHESSDKVASSNATLFLEHTQTLQHIASLSDETTPVKRRESILTLLTNIFDKYLECPTLLDPYLNEMVTAMATRAFQLMQSKADDHKHLLSVLYVLCKVRGRKKIQHLLPHGVSHVEVVLEQLQKESTISSSNDASWKSVFVLWLWLGKLSLIPFDCKVFWEDAGVKSESVVALAKQHLTRPGPTSDSAASCLAAWLTRRDWDAQLEAFVTWSRPVLDDTEMNHFVVLGVLKTLNCILKSGGPSLADTMDPLWPVTLRLSKRCGSNSATRKLLTKWFTRMACAHLPPKVARWRYQQGRLNLLSNITQCEYQICETSKSTTDAKDSATEQLHNDPYDDFSIVVPDQVEDSMDELFVSLKNASTVVRWSAAKGIGRVASRLPSLCAHDILDNILTNFFDKPDKDHAWHGACLAIAELARRGLLLPIRLPDVVPWVVKAMQYDVRRGHTSVGAHVRDAACYCCWAFSRAYAPSVLKPFVSDLRACIVLTCLFDREVNCRRAASAAFQECVGRQGADRCELSILTAADFFSLSNRRNAYTIIAHRIAQFEIYQKPIFHHLYTVKLYHWDVAIRTLASQSLGGLTDLDCSYMATSVLTYLLPKCTDSEFVVRHGAVLGLSEAVLAIGASAGGSKLDRVSSSNVSAIAELVPKIEKARLYRGRGGELMRSAVCRLIECTSLANVPLTARQQVRLLDSVDTCLKHPSPTVQESASTALSALVRAYFPVSDKGPSNRLQSRVVDKYVSTLDTQDSPAASRGFALALGSLPSKLLAPSTTTLGTVLDCLCKAARLDGSVGGAGDAETRRNSLLSLTYVCCEVGLDVPKPPKSYPVVGLNQTQVSQVFDAFLFALEDYNTDRRGDVGSWSRIAAMTGLQRLTVLVLQSSDAGKDFAVRSIDDTRLVYKDRRKMEWGALNKKMGYSAERCDQRTVYQEMYSDRGLSVQVVGSLLKQLSEKLDLVRKHAGRCLEKLLTYPGSEGFVLHQLPLLDAFGLSAVGEATGTNWAAAEITFPMVMKAADLEDYFPFVFSGMVISIGGITKRISQHASTALLSWIRRQQVEMRTSRIESLGQAILDMFKLHGREGRVILPLLETLEKLVAHRCLEHVLQDEESCFARTLFSSLRGEATNCTNVQRLLAIVSVASTLLACEQDNMVKEVVLPFLLGMLAHPYPRVRRHTSEQLYMRLLEGEGTPGQVDNISLAMELIVTTSWDCDASAVDETRQQIANMMGVEIPSGAALSKK